MPTRSALARLLSGVKAKYDGDPDTEVSGIAYDSRQVQPGDAFVAVPGYVRDGAEFVADAVDAGAAAIVAQVGPDAVNLPSPPAVWARVDDARAVLAPMAAEFYRHPSGELTVVGVTGTNGKTTTTALLEAMLSARGPVGRWSTTTVSVAGEASPAHRTTPEGPDLQRTLRAMVDADCWAAAIEVSSHALFLHRVDGTRFAAAVFTNLSDDHRDFHENFDEYLAAKASLFERLDEDGLAVLNIDDPAAHEIARRTAARVVGYGWKNRPLTSAQVRARLEFDVRGRPPDDVAIEKPHEPIDVLSYRIADWRCSGNGSRLRLDTPRGELDFETPLFGQANAENLAAAIATTLELGCSVEEITPRVAEFAGARGRFQRLFRGQPFAVFVDFAHTPAALRAALEAARALAGAHRVIVVFGCGGDRDQDKRPQMGKIAAADADHVMITSDNPRGEDPEAILDAIQAGIPDGTTAQIERNVDRREAIEHALGRARPGDCVLIAGKGHETQQVFADRTVDFDDVEVADAWLQPRFGDSAGTSAEEPEK